MHSCPEVILTLLISGLKSRRERGRMITTILWDVDGTLLDFLAAEKAAIQSLFEEDHLGECTDEKIAR